ncbi:MAG: aminotransferase class I/II-fold pyridoxal phosphate-dependent enzyme [Bacteriovoracaceae bacterium]|nr:aminotransferase class I/II-fold pyridoxal phosphate-dependent enzyme [Bacteriovoracaceae bacterium]
MIRSYGKSKVLKRSSSIKKLDLYPFFRPIEASAASRVTVDGDDLVMIGSNNYLGLTHHPEVIEATKKALDRFGTGCTGSRFLNGNLTIHEELEEKLAKYVGHEKALVFSTGMQSNLGALSTLCGPKDCMLFDAENHASIVDSSRLSLGTTFKFKHNDMKSLRNQLESVCHRFSKVIIVADGVFSMTGDILNLPEVIKLAQEFGVLIYLDDAHGLGVMGKQGRGTMDYFNATKDVHFNMGTFSKSFASIGGFVSGPSEAMDYIKHTARSFMFSAAMPPAAVATVSACIDVVTRDPSILESLWSNVDFMQKGFKEIGLYTYNSQTPIIPVFVGDDLKALQVTQYLYDQGVFATPVLMPAVPKNEALIRTSYMAGHSRSDLTKVLEVFSKARKLYDLPSVHH